MEKTNKELRFKYYATSSEKAADADKSPYDVAFVGGERKIYTHNVSFGGSELPDMSDYYNKTEVDSIASDLTEDIVTMNASIEDVKNDADEISSDLNTFKGQIREEVDGAISDVQTNITQTSDNKYVAKATLATEVTDIVEGEIGVQTLAAVAVKSDVDEAKSELITRYDNKYDELDSNISAVRTTANSASSKVESVTASGSGGTTIFNQSLLDSLMAGIVADNTSGTNAQIKLIAEGQSSGIDIQAAIDTAVALATANFTTKTYVDTADGNLATSITQIRNAVTDSNDNLISSSTIQSKANANEAKLAAIANWNGDTPVSYKSGLLSSSDMDGAIAGLFASSSTSSAKDNVDSLINSEVSPVSNALANVTSRVTTIEGNYVAESALNAVVDNDGNVTAASVIAAVNDAGSSVKLSGDHIEMDGLVISGDTIAKDMALNEEHIHFENDPDETYSDLSADHLKIGDLNEVNSELTKTGLTVEYTDYKTNVGAGTVTAVDEQNLKAAKIASDSIEVGEYVNASLVTADYVTTIEPGSIVVNGSLNPTIQLVDAHSHTVSITAEGVTYNGTTKTWTQIFAAIS